ncbi:hypothetical protein PR048_012545 [Dryococelus australis]|uniref:Uncharacterized protein n=1 Tax=Dryococelus australis TaxID=614101 RepID=A0ABQ9HPN7_9NEOP|nr:hypothetical protein PR048_012545 [Dryococelus australis]
MRVIEVSMKRSWNEGAGETGDPRENPPTNNIIRHNSHFEALNERGGGRYPGVSDTISTIASPSVGIQCGAVVM